MFKNNSQNNFISMIIHELRSPLETIKRTAGLIRSNQVPEDKRQEYMEMIYKGSSDMLSLINNLLDLSKIEAGKFIIEKQPSNIKEIIEGRIDFFQTAAKDAKVTLEAEFGEKTSAFWDFDQHAISQVLNNFLSNAIKFSKENGRVVVQAVFCKKGDDFQKEARKNNMQWFLKNTKINLLKKSNILLVAVTDGGEGIADENIKQLFKNFSQIKNNFVENKGTGLGLAVSKNIIEEHKGEIGVESKEGRGSTFYFAIPVD